MKIRNMFQSDITREIQGVIKVDQQDEEIVYNDLQEFVVTRELYKNLDSFFSAYINSINSRTDKMGCWIWGFFGSGKSHFLKILSYLLKNAEVKGKKAVSYFDGKIQNPALLANMKLAGDISSDVILFNIDYKADSDSKFQKDAIVKVFMKVFNEMQGFCGSMPWVAEIEYQMTKEGTYDAFKQKFLELSGQPWEDGRYDFYFEGDSIVQALAQTTKMSLESARNWYEKCESTYTLSVEKFARRVREYIESKPKNHHVVFLCDEMGQYIGESDDLLLNLQTVVEALGVQCGGKAWVICTSQQAIDDIVKVRSDQFSKILARFDTRLLLSSANVDEVIKRRLLIKNNAATETLGLYFDDKEAILKNQLTFSNAAEMKIYKDAADFAAVYPFVPYQFQLVQSIFNGIRLHGASGKHLSEGERSLLSGFQESVFEYLDDSLGALVPLYAFYDTIEQFLDHNIKVVFDRAERNDELTKPIDINVLKVLFMLKHVKELKTNVDNLAAVVLTAVDQDKLALKKNIDAALRRLEKQTLIQKNGDEYIFLTNEEQDINREIQRMSIESSELIDKIGDLIFADIYPDRKYRYSRYDFGFNQVIDDRPRGQQKEELTLCILTPYYTSDASDTTLKMLTIKDNLLVVKLPDDISFMEEMENALKIETFLRRKSGMVATDEIEVIKASKAREARTRKERSRQQLISSLKKADIYTLGRKLGIGEKSPQERLADGFKELVEGIYTKLGYIKKFIDTTSELSDFLLVGDRQITIGYDQEEDHPNKLALEELASFITRNSERNIPITIKTILDNFSKPPYGYRELDIQGLIAVLLQKQEIRLIFSGEYVDASNPKAVDYLTKREFVERVQIKTRPKVASHLINNAKALAKALFGCTSLPQDEDGLMAQFQELCCSEYDTIVELLGNYNGTPYPGQTILEQGRDRFHDILQFKDPADLFCRLEELYDELLDYEEEAADVKKFFSGNQRTIFDKAINSQELFEANRVYLSGSAEDIICQIEDIVSSPVPYSQIIKLPELTSKFEQEFSSVLDEERALTKQVINSDWAKIKHELELYSASDQLQSQCETGFKNLLDKTDQAEHIYEAVAMKDESDRLKARLIKNIQAEFYEQARKSREKMKDTNMAGEPTDTIEPVLDYITSKTVNITLNELLPQAWYIKEESDIDLLLEQIKQKLKDKLTANTVIRLL